MGNEIRYKGFQIRAAPNQLVENKKWTVEVFISKDHGSRAIDAHYCAGNSYATKEEAERHCLTFGCQIVNGQYPQFSLP